MTALPCSLERTLVVRAPRAVVFRSFSDPARFAAWWGEGSSIDGAVGGELRIRHPNGVVVRGAVTAFEPERRVAFTYGYENAHPELPPGSSLVTIALDDAPDGTSLSLRHELPTQAMRDAHVPGWRYHLAVLANAVADAHHAAVTATVDSWFAAWAAPDATGRRALLERCTTDRVELRDRWACLAGRDELDGHIAAVRTHMPGAVMRRDGDVRHCQGTAIVDFGVEDAQGTRTARGTLVVRLAPDGRIRDAAGFPA